MKLQYASDLHLEMVMNDAYVERYPLVRCGDILLLAGDIINLQKRQYLKPHFDTWSKNYDLILLYNVLRYVNVSFGICVGNNSFF